MALASTATADSTWSQISDVKILPTSGTAAPQGKKNVLLKSYLATRDTASVRGNYKTNPVGTVGMKFQAGSTVDKAAVGSANVCQESEYATIPTLASKCAKAVIGTGWALLNSGNPAPQTQMPGAPPTCAADDATQYSRTWQSNPDAMSAAKTYALKFTALTSTPIADGDATKGFFTYAVTSSGSHGLKVGDPVQMSGFTSFIYNSVFTVSKVVSSTQFEVIDARDEHGFNTVPRPPVTSSTIGGGLRADVKTFAPGACIPRGFVYTQVTAYQGGELQSKYWCYGLDYYSQPESSFRGKSCTFKDAAGKKPFLKILGVDANGKDIPNPAYNLTNKTKNTANGCNIIFANNNGVAPLAFGGSVSGCGGVLSVVIPSLNGTGSGLGELTGGLTLSDFSLNISNKKFLKAGACVASKYTVSTGFTYSKLKGESDYSKGSLPTGTTVDYSGTCRK
jgi:hypothetical protein